ncbi:MAG: VWA domain-containing protein, partial [Phycisphaerales bacterium]|nr:VWA domain-containing protein [Phycisphaerales bacterium]
MAILLLLAAAYSLFAAWRTDLPWKRWRVSSLVICRLLLLVALAAWCLELRFNFNRAAKKVELVVLADRSPSLSAKGRQDVDQWISQAKQQLANGTVSVVDFGNDATVDSATPMTEAIDQARCLFTGKCEKRILLVSDGRWTTTDPLATVGRLQDDKVAVYSVPMEPLGNESLIAGLTVAPSLWRAVPSPVDVQLYASAAGSCRLTLLVDGEKKDERDVTLPKGASIAEMSVTLETEGVHRIEVRGEFAHDTLPWNNTASALVDVRMSPRVMIVSEPKDAVQLEKALAAGGLAQTTKVRAPSTLPTQGFDCDCIVLNNVPASSFSEPMLKAMRQFVYDGGGIVFVGGPKSFAAGGYVDTPLDEAFPVQLIPEKDQPPYGLVVVLDNSWSMNEGITSAVGKINLAKEIAIVMMENLNKGDWVSLVSFDSEYHNIFGPTQVTQLNPLADEKYQTSRIGAFGMTNILGGLTEAARQLQAMDAGYKHIVLISDGHETETGTDYSRLLAVLIKQHVTVSTIGVGLSPNDKVLNTIAYSCKGRYYTAKSLAEIPAVMLQEAKGMSDPLVVNASLPIRKVNEDPATVGIDVEKLPPLGGYNRTRARTHAWTPLTIANKKNEPLLARMRYGRGQSLAFTSSASSPWAREWLQKDKVADYAAFWRQAVLSVLGPPYRPLAVEETYRQGQPSLKLLGTPEGQIEIRRLKDNNVSPAAAASVDA